MTELAKLYHRLSKQYGRIFRANKLDQKIKIILVLSSVAMSGQWEAVSLDLWPGVCSILLPWDRPPRPPLTLITAETCPPCPPRARVPRHFIATASYFTPSTSQQQIAPWRPQVNRSCIIQYQPVTKFLKVVAAMLSHQDRKGRCNPCLYFPLLKGHLPFYK